LKDEARGHRERRNEGNVDAAPEDHDRHRETEDAEHRDILQQS
jgi:hypothetical protein